MNHIYKMVLTITFGILSAYVLTTYAEPLQIPGGSILREHSIIVPIESGDPVTIAKSFGFKILGILRMVVSGFALIYLVMIGAYMIMRADSEENVKTQRKQITYSLIGFLFLNIPSLVYTVFSPDTASPIASASNWSSTTGGSIFWNTAGFEGIIGNMIAFLRVFAFGAAVLMFTWGLFDLIVSAGNDEKRKKATNRIVYGTVGLIFLGFVTLWGDLIANGDFKDTIPRVTGTLFSLVMYFAAPIAIFTIIWGAYYFITSAGDEERMKKGKSIIINTGIAFIILLSAMSFITDLSTFQL